MKPTHRNPLLRNLVLAATICLSFGQAAHAASVYWDTNGTTTGSGVATGTWGTSAFWTTTEAGTATPNGTLPTANDDVFIAAGTNGTTGTITIDTTKVAGSLTIQEPAANPGVTISGGTSLTLGGGSTTTKGLFVTGNGTHTVSTPLILSGANIIQTAGTGTLIVNGGLTGTGDLTFRNNSTSATGIQVLASQVNITGAISNAGTSSGTAIIGNANGSTGTGGLSANVTSVSQNSATSALQILNADNSTYAGNYNINAGTLQFAGTNSAGSITATNAASVINLGATTGTNAATLYIVNNAVSGKVNNNINVRAGSAGAKTITVNSGVTYATSGTITLDDNLVLSAATAGTSFLNPNGLISNGANGAKGITKAGAGTVNFSTTHAYTGATSVTAGVLALTDASGTLANTSAIAVSGGTLQLNNTAAANLTNRIPDATVITMNGGTLDFKNDAAATTNYSETVSITAASTGTISTSQAAGDGESTLTIGTFNRNPGTFLTFSGTGLGVDATNRIFFPTSPATNGVIPWAMYGAFGYASYDATNGVTETTDYTDIDVLGDLSAPLIANDSTANVRILSDGSGTNNIALGSATTSINTLLQANNGADPAVVETVGKTLRTNAAMLLANTQALTIGTAADDGTLTAASAGGELFLINNSTANALTLNSVIANNTSASSVSKAGAGNAIFAGTNTYTGATNLTGGIVTAANNNAFGTGAVTINPTTTRLVINDGLTLTNDITFKGGGVASRGVFENSGTGEATLSGTITIDGLLAGGGHFASVSTGTLNVTGAINSSSPAVSSRLGTVVFSGGGSYANFLLNAGTAKLGANNGLSTSATADLAFSAAGNFDLNGFNQTLVGITRSQGNAATIGNGSSTNDSTLTVTGTSTYAGNIANVIGTPTTPKTTSLVVGSGSLTLSGGFSAQNATINNGATLTLTGTYTGVTPPTIQAGGTLIIGPGGGDGINPATKTLVVPSGALLKNTGSDRVQNDVVITVASGGTFDLNATTDVIGYISGAGSITNLTNATGLRLNMPATGSGSEFSGTISGSTLINLQCAGTGASASSTLILSGANTGLTAATTFNVQGGRLIGRNTAAFGNAGKIISLGAAALTLDPTIEFGNDSPLNSYVLNIGSGNTGTFELNRATPGAALVQPAGASTLGNGIMNIEKGANVTSGTPTLEFASLALSAGGPGLGSATLNPVGVNVSVLGSVTRATGTFANNLKLDGTSTGNVIAGAMQDNGASKLNVTKQNTSTWTLGGTNTYTGTTIVNGGTLHLTGSLAAGSAVTVGGAAATGTPTLTGAGGTVNGALTIAAAGAGVAGTVNPGTVGTIGTLNAGATTIAGTYACDVSGTSTDRLVVVGNLTLGGTLSINEIASGTPGTYVIATYTGTRTGELGGTLPSGYSVNYDDANKEVELVVTSASGYGAWASTNAGGQAADLDFDNDGVANGVEYFLGAAGSSSILNKTATWTNGGNIDPSAYGTQFVVQTSTNLVSWADVPAIDPNLSNSAGSVSYTLSGSSKEFMRLKVTPN